jgi:hypothetical protein
MLLCLLQGLPTASAEDRALLVGIGNYEIEAASLPGIGRDIRSMHDMAGELGFDERQVLVLQDRAATLAGIRIAVQRHLIHGVSSDDRVLLYFSGHGTQVPDYNGDEEDGVDESLLPFDAKLVSSRGRQQLVNVLTDDELETMLAAIPAGEIVVIVDACHSGTVTRAPVDPDNLPEVASVPKSFIYEGMPEPGKTLTKTMKVSGETYNYVGLSAAADNELAIATENGSLFTAALVAELREASNSQPLSVFELAGRVAARIRRNVEPERVFTPQLSGDLRRAESVHLQVTD